MELPHSYSLTPTYTTTNHFIHTSRPTRVSPSQQHVQSAPAPAYLTNAPLNYYSNPHGIPQQQPVQPTFQFRLPLLAPTLGFTSDFQATAPRVLDSTPSWRLPLNDDKPSAYGHGLGARPEPSFSSAGSLPGSASVSMPLPASGRLPTIFMPTPHAIINDWNHSFHTNNSAPLVLSPRQFGSGPSTSSLLLEDICHVEAVEDHTSGIAPVSCRIERSESGAMSIDEPYSACPAADFTTPSWSPPRPPSPSYCDLSEPEDSFATLLKKEPEDDYFCFSPTPASANEDSFGPAPLLGLFADVNMREIALKEQVPSACVNPADVMGDSPVEPSPEPEYDDSPSMYATPSSGSSGSIASLSKAALDRGLSHTPDFTGDFPDDSVIKSDFPEEAISAIVSVLQSSVKQEIQEPTGPSCDGLDSPQDSIKTCEPQLLYLDQTPGYPSNSAGKQHPSLAFGSGCGGATFNFPRMPLADIQLPQNQQIEVPPFGVYAPFTLPSVPADFVDRRAPPQPSSPVLNAHAGIELDELRRRAADFRMRHPDSELDRSFLQCFAGRLSDRGELLDEYRCYVVGCGQRNKRRDHILVHVGSHVEHRPWQCQHCGMRFLRKNECKRHESSHEGRKPYSCQICAPFQDRSFVRQDLLKRHMRVTHGVHDTSRASGSGRKRMEGRKADENAGWP